MKLDLADAQRFSSDPLRCDLADVGLAGARNARKRDDRATPVPLSVVDDLGYLVFRRLPVATPS